MSKLIFDIETVGEDFDALDPTTQEVLTHWIKKESDNEKEYKEELEILKDRLGFSPLTGEIVAIGALNYETDKGEVYFQAPGEEIQEFEEDGLKFRPMTEKQMLAAFWAVADKFQEFITFNGRTFDVPFLMIRSAIHGIRPTKDMMSNRYLSSQNWKAKHVDLFDQLTFYGALRRKGGLHLWSRAFGIKSPKAEGITGDDVGRLFKEKKYADIARYNAGDLRATKGLYRYWRDFMAFD